MKRSGFTLIELIFVIVIIGVLAAVAVPKFTNLKANASAKAVVKTVTDGANSAAEAAVNQMDLEETVPVLEDILTIKGKNWSYSSNTYTYNEGGNDIATISLDTDNRIVQYTINCDEFEDTATQTKCKNAIGDGTVSSIDENITF